MMMTQVYRYFVSAATTDTDTDTDIQVKYRPDTDTDKYIGRSLILASSSEPSLESGKSWKVSFSGILDFLESWGLPRVFRSPYLIFPKWNERILVRRVVYEAFEIMIGMISHFYDDDWKITHPTSKQYCLQVSIFHLIKS